MKKINTYSVKNWSEIPTVWKNTKEVKKVKYTNSPFDKELTNMLSPIAGDDDLRQIMNGVHFDDYGITATNAHVLVSIPSPNPKFKGTYATIPKRNYIIDKGSDVSIKDNLFLSPKYPQYENVIPKQKDAIRTQKVNIYKILQWTEVALKYCNRASFSALYWFGDVAISFNAKYMIESMKLLLKLGYSEVYCSSTVGNRAVVFSPDAKYELGKSVIVLLMPVMWNNGYSSKDESENVTKGGSFDLDFSRELLAYYDFSTDEIRNSNDSVAEFKMFYGDYDVLPQNEIKMLNKFAEKNTYPILDFFAVRNNHIHASDLASSLLIKHTDLEDGLYDVLDGAIELNEEMNSDEYPLAIKIEEPKIKFIIGSDVLYHYISIALKFVSKDDLRPQLTGIFFDYKDGKMFIVATNAHILGKIDITKYIEVNKDQVDFNFIVNINNLTKFFNNIEDSAVIVSADKNNVSFENEKYTFTSRLIEAKYSNYEGVISNFNEKKLNLSKKELLDCINSDEAKKFIKDHKKEQIIIFDELGDEGRLNIYVGVSDVWRKENGNPPIIEKVKVGNISYSNEEGTFQIADSTLLIMPMAIENVNLFAFDVKYLSSILDALNCDSFDFLYRATNRGYFITGSCLNYGTVVKPISVHKEVVQEVVKVSSKDSEIEELEMLIELLKEVVSENPKDLDSKDVLELYEENLIELKKANTEKLAKGGSIDSMTEGKIKSVLDKDWSFDDRIESYRNRIKRGKYIDKEFNGEEYFLIEEVDGKKVYQPVGKIVYDFFDKNIHAESNDEMPVPEVTNEDVDSFFEIAKHAKFKKSDFEEWGNPTSWSDDEMEDYLGDSGRYYYFADEIAFLKGDRLKHWFSKLKKAVGEVYEERIEKFEKGGDVGCGCSHSYEEGGEIKKKKVIRRNLPINKEYKLVDSFYTGGIMDNPMSCENCGRPIANVAVIEDEDGKKYDVGMDCAETLSQIKNSLEFNIAQNDFNEANAIRTRIRTAFKKNPNAILEASNTYTGTIHLGMKDERGRALNGVSIPKDFFFKYLPEFKNKISNPEKNNFRIRFDSNYKIDLDANYFKKENYTEPKSIIFDSYKIVISRENVPNYNSETGEIRNYNDTIVIKIFKSDNLIGERKTYMVQDISSKIIYAINEYEFENYKEEFKNGGYIQTLPYSEILKRLKDEFGIDESDGKSIHGSDLIRIIQVDKNIDPNAGLNLSKVLTDNGWTIIKDNYEQGGLIEDNDSKYFSKTFESKGNTWNILFVWGRFNYVSVSKKTNNPFGSGIGKEFKNVDEAIAYYKNPDMKVQLIFAENEAKEFGYVPKFENGGELKKYWKKGDSDYPLDYESVKYSEINYDIKDFLARTNKRLIITTKDGKKFKGSVGKMFNSLTFFPDYIRQSDIEEVQFIPSSLDLDDDELKKWTKAQGYKIENFENGGSIKSTSEELNKEAEDILRVGKIETDIRNEKDNTRTIIVEIKPNKEYALIVKKNGNVIKLAKGQNELSLLLNKDKFENGGGIDDMSVQFIEYNGQEIMFEPHDKKYYSNDEEFTSLEEAKKYIDNGSKLSSKTINAYRHGAFEKGGEIEEKELYYAVYNEHTLGLLFINESGRNKLLVLHGSPLKGSPYTYMSMPLSISDQELKQLRKATEKDFDEYRVSLPPDFKKLNIDNFENGGYVNVPSEKVIEDFYKSIESNGENTTVGIYKKEGLLTDDAIDSILQGYATGATPKEKFELTNRIYRKSINMQKGDVVYFNEKEYGKKFRGEILDVLNENDFLVSRGIKTFIINKNDIIGLAPKKEDDLFNSGVSIYDERVTDINSTVFYTTYGVGNNPFEVNYEESNEYGYGIYFLDGKYSGVGKYKESRILAIKPNVKKPLIFLNDDGSSFNSQYKEAYDNSVKYDGVTSKDDFNRKMVEMGYDSMLVSDIHGMHLIFFYNDPDLYEIKSDKGA